MKRLIGVVALCLLTVSAIASQGFVLAATEFMRPVEPAVDRVLKSAGIHATFSYYPQARLVKVLQEGQVDGAFLLTEAALQTIPGLVKVPVELMYIDVVAVSIEPGIKVTSLDDLKRYTVAIERGNGIHKTLTAGMSPYEATDLELLFKMLAGRRFQVALCTASIVPGLARQAGIPAYTIHAPPLKRIPQFFVLTQRGANRMDSIRNAFAQAVQAGTWQSDIAAILAAYNK